MYYKQISILLLIIIFCLLYLLNKKTTEMFINKKPKLVVLYSTQYRTWEDTCQNHIELMRHLAGSEDNCIIGIHYWNNDTPDLPPEPIQKLHYKHSHTDQNIPQSNYFILNSMIQSTKIAFENAKQLYKEFYNEEMPDNQLILRLRPDVFIENISKIPKSINSDNFYLSMWNINHRAYNAKSLETGDVMCLTTKKAFESLLNSNLNNIDEIINNYIKTKGWDIKFVENQLYALLEYLGINIINDSNLHIAIMRPTKNLDKLTYR